MFVLDSHCDTPSQILRLRDISRDNPRSQVDFPKLRAGGVDASFFALYVPAEMSPDDGFAYAGKLLEATRRAVADNASAAAFASTVPQAMENKKKGLISIFLGLENGTPLATDFSRLDWFASRGIRYVTLCHNADNQICDSAAQGHSHGGLSAFGKKLVRRMNDKSILVDCAHISDASFRDVLKCSHKPVVSTHSCCRALSDHPRNMSDEMISALASEGGVLQINFYPVFLQAEFARLMDTPFFRDGDRVEQEFIADPSDEGRRAAWEKVEDALAALPRPSYKRIADHIEHAVEVAGIEHVGIGSDFDGISVTPEGMENVSCLPVLFEELRQRGFSESDVSKIAGENFLRLL